MSLANAHALDVKRALPVMVAAAVAAVVGATLYFSSSDDRADRVDGAKLAAAVRAYADNLKAQGLPAPESVSLEKLIDLGLLSKSDAGPLSGLEVTISSCADESRPQDIIARVRLPEGPDLVVLADGSVQQVRR